MEVEEGLGVAVVVALEAAKAVAEAEEKVPVDLVVRWASKKARPNRCT